MRCPICDAETDNDGDCDECNEVILSVIAEDNEEDFNAELESLRVEVDTDGESSDLQPPGDDD